VNDFVYRELDHVRVKGKDKPVAIYEPIGPAAKVSSAVHDEIKLFHEMRRLYRKQDWDQAELQLMNLQRMSPDTALYHIYIKRIAYFVKTRRPADWDGVFVFETKWTRRDIRIQKTYEIKSVGMQRWNRGQSAHHFVPARS